MSDESPQERRTALLALWVIGLRICRTRPRPRSCW